MGRFFALGLVAATCIAIAMAVGTACITAPPPQLPAEVEHRPTIMHESVQPPAELTLTGLPTEFVVPVVLEDPNESFEWDIFIDYNPCNPQTNCQPTPPRTPPGIVPVQPTPATEDGGSVTISFPPPTDLDPTQCHTIQFVVAHKFLQGLPHTPDSVGGDLVMWTYNPGGAIPCTSLVYDAGSLQDGAFPPSDAPTEALPVVPESGTD